MWYNPMVAWLLRSPLHGVVSRGTLLLTYTGRETGVRYTLPISYGRDAGDLVLITHRRKRWWRNLLGGARVTLRLHGQDRSGWGSAQAAGLEATVAAMQIAYPGMPARQIRKLAPEMIVVRVQPDENPALVMASGTD